MRTAFQTFAWFAYLALTVVTSAAAFGQQAAAVCNFPFKLAGAQVTTAQNNTKAGCASWSFVYAGDAPVEVETSIDGASWGTSGLTFTSGSLPTAGGFGVVKFTGYAPYFRVKSSGSVGQTVNGLLYGSLGLAASDASLPNYVFASKGGDKWASDDPGIVYSKIDSSTTFTKGDGMMIGVSKDYGANSFQFVCRAYPTPPFTARWDIAIPPQYWTNDAGHHIFMFAREAATEKWTAMWYRDKQFLYIGKCTKGSALCDTSGGAIDGEFNIGSSETWPITFEWKDDGTTTTYGFYDRVAKRSALIKNSPITSPSNGYEVRNQLCVGSLSSNGNYPNQFNIVGYELVQ